MIDHKVDPSLTHIQVVLCDANGTAMLYGCDALDAQAAVEQFRSLDAFTVVCENGLRYTFRSERVLVLEQMTRETADRRMVASQQAQAEREAEMQAQAVRAAIMPTNGRPRPRG